MYKCYIVIYTCSSTKGVVLHLVPDASAETFMNSLAKFISKRGCPQIISSDNEAHLLLTSLKFLLLVKC